MHINVKLLCCISETTKMWYVNYISLCVYINEYIYKYIFILDRAKMKYSTK